MTAAAQSTDDDSPLVEPPTPTPFYLSGPPAQCGLAPMSHHEKSRYRTAAFHAKRIYPGPVGELISQEILAWEDFGYRIGDGRLISDLVDHLMKTPRP